LPGTTYYFNIKAVDANSNTVYGAVLSFTTAVQLAQGSPTTGSVTVSGSAAFTAQLTVTGSPAGLAFSSPGSSSPAGLAVSAGGLVTTTGSLSAQTYTVTGTTSDTAGDTGTYSYALTVQLVAPVVSAQLATPVVSVSASPASPTSYGTLVTMTAVVTSGATGSVTFASSLNGVSYSAIAVCTGVNMVSSVATCATNALPEDTEYLEAVYSGNSTYATATSVAYPYAVGQVTQAALTLTATPDSGVVGKAVTLSTTGGSSTGAVTYSVTNGTAKSCTVSGASLTATSEGTCIVTATKAADTNVSAATSRAVTVSFIQPYQVYRVYGAAMTGRTVNMAMTGVGFFGRPTIRSSAPGTSTLVLKDHGNWMFVRVTVSRLTARGVHTFSVILPNGTSAQVNYTQR
jgi:hypothetical protein